jgi:hypothetical protein
LLDLLEVGIGGCTPVKVVLKAVLERIVLTSLFDLRVSSGLGTTWDGFTGRKPFYEKSEGIELSLSRLG